MQPISETNHPQPSASDRDPYKVPVFTVGQKARRLVWNAVWLLLCSWTPRPAHFWRVWILRLFGAKIGRHNAIYPSARIWAPWLLRTEDTVTIGPGVEVYNPGGVYLGHHAIVSQNAYLCGATHNYQSANFDFVQKEIIIEPYAWICARAVVLPGVTCGAGSVLGALSVTSRDLAEWTVYAGNPCSRIKARNNFTTKGDGGT